MYKLVKESPEKIRFFTEQYNLDYRPISSGENLSVIYLNDIPEAIIEISNYPMASHIDITYFEVFSKHEGIGQRIIRDILYILSHKLEKNIFHLCADFGDVTKFWIKCGFTQDSNELGYFTKTI